MTAERRKTKIVCTMGPHLFEKNLIPDLMRAGMDVARFNFSHGTHETQLKSYNEVCRIRGELGLPVATMLDTKGPEIRIGDFAGHGKVRLEKGQRFTLTAEDIEGDSTRVSVLYKELVHDVKAGGRLLIDDGLVGMTIEEIRGGDIICRVDNSGVISDRKGVNVPDVHLSMPYISDKDRADIEFAAEHGFDFIAASFTRSAEDIAAIRRILQEKGGDSIRIIAKIENKEGIRNIDEILRAADALMVARGDMGVEIPIEDVPELQKLLIRKCVDAGKPVITATQMLDSMMKNPRPTRAEATDVANAIYDGTSAIMLSGETASGLYPLEAVQTMARIAVRAENDPSYMRSFAIADTRRTDVTTAIGHATVTSARDLKASAVITVTKSGTTARVISKYRPACPIIGCTADRKVWRQMSLSWGVIPLMIEEADNTDGLFDSAVEASVKAGLIRDGELVVMTAGVPLGISGTTNLMKVHVVGHLLARGVCGVPGNATAPVYVVEDGGDIGGDFRSGEILVCSTITRAMLPQLRKAGGLIIEDPDPDGQGVIAGMSLDIPVIIGAANAVRVLKTGAVVQLDANKGTVSCN